MAGYPEQDHADKMGMQLIFSSGSILGGLSGLEWQDCGHVVWSGSRVVIGYCW
jgi:hypothetical protein